MTTSVVITLEDWESISISEFEDDCISFEFKDIDGFYYTFTASGTGWTLTNTTLDEQIGEGGLSDIVRDQQDMIEFLAYDDIYLVTEDNY